VCAKYTEEIRNNKVFITKYEEEATYLSLRHSFSLWTSGNESSSYLSHLKKERMPRSETVCKAMENIYINMPTGILCSMDRASYNMAIIIQQDATEYSLFTFVNCSTCFGWYFTHHHEIITLYLQ